ncbi:phage major capsid family protein [Porphyromonas cangingivalis]|uniref:Phage capsid family protein n=1 Tax=Porphyromonas cangingivalis TaxID=36874 RepID=A0A1T4KK19_PORCN|nr:phage major capsid protein [Porphyromonas cangingivalis]SJZ42735.1 Phage capsid family protein [Porphyromonas cangingivalis]VEJ02601.1 Predicted phage phi-C31 gp36 major capsid-like protein [Porphyromonas cangingivalis]
MKKKPTLLVRELINKYQANCDRINEIADLCEREARQRNDAEQKEFDTLCRDNQMIQMRIQVSAADFVRDNPGSKAEAEALIRENAQSGKHTEIRLMRDFMMVSDVQSAGVIPVNVMDIIRPLAEGLILDKVGLPFNTGLAGDYIWPTYEAVEATIAGEGVALSDTKFTLSKLTATPQRVGIAIPVTRQTINRTSGIIEMIILEIMPLAFSKLLNKIVFSTTTVSNATTLKGPFVDKVSGATEWSGDPSFLDFNKMKAKVLETGVDGDHMCWVMTKSRKAIAEATPKDKGSGIMVCENDMIAGLPVFTTNYIGQEYIGLGDWRYQPMGLFGDISFIVDPYSQARKDAVDFVMNADYGTTTLMDEAFALAKING